MNKQYKIELEYGLLTDNKKMILPPDWAWIGVDNCIYVSHPESMCVSRFIVDGNKLLCDVNNEEVGTIFEI